MIDSSDGPGPCRRSVCQSPRGAGRQQMAVCSAPCVVSLLPTPPFSSPSALVTRPPSPPPQAGLFVCCGRASGHASPSTPGQAPGSRGRAHICVLGLLILPARRPLLRLPPSCLVRGLDSQDSRGAWHGYRTCPAPLWSPPSSGDPSPGRPSSQALGTLVLVGLSLHKKHSESLFTAADEQNRTSLLIFVGRKLFCI